MVTNHVQFLPAADRILPEHIFLYLSLSLSLSLSPCSIPVLLLRDLTSRHYRAARW
jgi:hypothetical protein